MLNNSEKLSWYLIWSNKINHFFKLQIIKYIVNFIWPLIVAFITFIVGVLIDTLLHGGDYWKNIDKYRNNDNFTLFGVFYLTVQIFYWYLTNIKKDLKDIVFKISEKVEENTGLIEKHLRSSKIVFEAGIAEYDYKHLLAMQRILNKLPVDVVHVYAIDNSDPTLWWSDSMTGYLGLLAKWKAHDTENKRRMVSRIFVYSDNELLSPVLAKTLTLHSLIGFRTYIFSEKIFSKIFDDLKIKSSNIIEKKEILIWNDSKKNKINFELDNKQWNNVNCYQSFWSISSEKNSRYESQKADCFKWQNYYGQSITSKEIKNHVWFEFICCEDKISKNGIAKRKNNYWENIPDQYMLLIKELLENTYCCKNQNEVKQLGELNNFGIEIKTIACSECLAIIPSCMHKNTSTLDEKFEFTSEQNIKEMLFEYYNIINKS